MSNLKEIRAAMPAEFVKKFINKAQSYGMTQRQLAAVCISVGYKAFFGEALPPSLPLEPSPVVAQKAEKAVASRVAESDVAKRSLPFTLKAAFGAISNNKRGTSAEG